MTRVNPGFSAQLDINVQQPARKPAPLLAFCTCSNSPGWNERPEGFTRTHPVLEHSVRSLPVPAGAVSGAFLHKKATNMATRTRVYAREAALIPPFGHQGAG